MSLRVLTWNDTNWSVQSQVARSLKFWILVEEELFYFLCCVAETKALISCAVTYCTADLHLCFHIQDFFFFFFSVIGSSGESNCHQV